MSAENEIGGTEANPVYEIGSPAFDKITIRLNRNYYTGESFTIKTNNNSKDNTYIKTIRLNEESLSRFKIYHADIVKGGELVLEMSSEYITSSEN